MKRPDAVMRCVESSGAFQVLLSVTAFDVTSFPCPAFVVFSPSRSSPSSLSKLHDSIQYYKNDTNLLIIAAVWLQFRLIGCVLDDCCCCDSGWELASLEERGQPRLVVVQVVQVVGVWAEGHLWHLRWHHVLHLMLLLPLHAPVLEPDLNLPLAQTQGMSDLNPSPPG